MPYRPARPARVARLALALAMAGALPGATASADEPAKEAAPRRGYDFTRPQPGEILPNPVEGVGTPPQLREYVTVHAMSKENGQAEGGSAQPPPEPAAAPSASSPQPAGAPVSPQASPGSSGGAKPPQSAGAGGAGQGAPPAATAKPPSAAAYVQDLLSEEVARHGAGGPFVFKPSPLAETDVGLRHEEQKIWDSSVARLAASRQAWRTRRDQADEAAGSPTRRAASAETAPGRIVLSGAPAAVTGDLPDPAP